MKKKDPAFLFYYQDFMYGTRYFTDEQRGIYIKLMCEQADSKTGSIKTEDMNKICSSYDEDMIKTVLEKFKIDTNGYYNEILRERLTERRNFVESRRNNRKSKNDKEHMINICETYEEHMGNENRNKNEINTLEESEEPLEGTAGITEFEQPTQKQVERVFESRGYPKEDAENFWGYYNALGWEIKGQPIKHWTSLIIKWMNRSKQFNGNNNGSGNSKKNNAIVTPDEIKTGLNHFFKGRA